MINRLYALLARLAAWDGSISAWMVRHPPAHPSLDRVVQAGAHLGDSWLWALVTIYLWRTGRHARLLRAGLVSLGIQAAITLLVKQLVRRPRPGAGSFLYGPGPDAHSFPSGHAMRMMVIAMWASWRWPAWRWLGWATTALVSWCRVRLGIHYAGDVIAGWLLGLLIALAVRTWGIGRGEPRRAQR